MQQIKINESYASTYTLVYRKDGWKTLYKNGKEIGSTKTKGGVYVAAKIFNV